MTTSIILVRHAAHAHLGKILSGRTPGIPLSEAGRGQAARLRETLAGETLDGVQTSPVQRSKETAEAIAADRADLAVETVEPLNEIDFGDWSGAAFDDLEADPRWHEWNSERASGTTPGGETMIAAQHRAWTHITQAAEANPERTILMVSHCDIIRAVVARVLDLSLNAVHRFDVEPASITRLLVGSWGARLISLNEGAR